MNDITGKTVGVLLDSQTLIATVTGSPVNLAGLEGQVSVIVRAGTPANGTGTLSLQLQTSADGLTNWQNAGPVLASFSTAGGTVLANLNPVGCQAFVRCVATVGGSGPSFPACVLYIANQQYH